MKSAMDGFWSAGGCVAGVPGVAIGVVDIEGVEGGGGGDREDEEDGSCADKGPGTALALPLPCVVVADMEVTEERGLRLEFCCGDDDDAIPGLTVSILAFDKDRLTFTRPSGCDGLLVLCDTFRTEKVMREPTRLARVPLPPAPLPVLAPSPLPLSPTSLIARPCLPFDTSAVSLIVPILVLLLFPVPGNRGTDTDTVLSLRRRDASVRSADESDLEREGIGEGAGVDGEGDVDAISRLRTDDEDIDIDVAVGMDVDVEATVGTEADEEGGELDGDGDGDGVKYVSGASGR